MEWGGLGASARCSRHHSDGANGWYEFQDTLVSTLYWVKVPASNFLPGGPLENGTLTSAALYPESFTTSASPYNYRFADFGYYFQSTAVSLASFSAEPTASLLLIGLGGASLAAGVGRVGRTPPARWLLPRSGSVRSGGGAMKPDGRYGAVK